jgi:hypothetical protein
MSNKEPTDCQKQIDWFCLGENIVPACVWFLSILEKLPNVKATEKYKTEYSSFICLTAACLFYPVGYIS